MLPSDRGLEREMRKIDRLSNMSVTTEGDQRVIRVVSETGEGTMRFIEVMPGVYLMRNDFNMASCLTGFSSQGAHLTVNHCRSGRLEQPMPGGAYSYTAAGDLKVDDFTNHAGTYVFPSEHYHGISMEFDIDVCEEPVRQLLGGFPLSVRELRAKFCHRGVPYIMHGFTPAEDVFSDLYTASPDIVKPLARIKALELLLLLHRIEYQKGNQEIEYFYHAQVEKVKQARELMVSDIAQDHTVVELARRVGLPLTTFKACFKGVYGAPPYTYLRAYRMEQAKRELSETDRSIADIGIAVGYDSPSKFTAAFKAVVGMTPSAYRRTA